MRADVLERSVWREVKRLLSDPALVLQEVEHYGQRKADDEEASRLQREIASLSDRERRLVRLYSYGEVDEDVVRDEEADIRRQRQALDEQLRTTQSSLGDGGRPMDIDLLGQVCAAVADWLERADDEGRTLALEALQLIVSATVDAATIRGVLPAEAPEFITHEVSCPCSCSGEAKKAASDQFLGYEPTSR